MILQHNHGLANKRTELVDQQGCEFISELASIMLRARAKWRRCQLLRPK